MIVANYQHEASENNLPPMFLLFFFSLAGFSSLLCLTGESEWCHRSVNRIAPKSKIIKAKQTPQFRAFLRIPLSPLSNSFFFFLRRLAALFTEIIHPLTVFGKVIKEWPVSTADWRHLYEEFWLWRRTLWIPFQSRMISQQGLPKIDEQCANLPTSYANTSQCLLLIFDTLAVSLHNILNWIILYLTHTENMELLHAESHWAVASAVVRSSSPASCVGGILHFRKQQLNGHLLVTQDAHIISNAVPTGLLLLVAGIIAHLLCPTFNLTPYQARHLQLIPHSSVLMNISFHLEAHISSMI